MEGSSWVLEILTGKKPEQTSVYSVYKDYNSYNIKNDITNLYIKINKVRFMSKYGPGKIIQSLSKRNDIVKQIQKNVNRIYFSTNQTVQIVYLTSPRLQYILKFSNDDDNAILVYVPITDDEDWKN